MLEIQNNRRQQRQGQSFLLLTFLIGAIMIAAGAVFIAFALSLSASAYALRAGTVAESLASAGIEDVMVQLTRNAAFSSTGYNLTLNSGTTNVSVTQNDPSSGFVTSLSIATVGGVTRKLQAIFSENTTTYQINLVSLQTLP